MPNAQSNHNVFAKKITFGNTRAQHRYQWPKQFKVKIEKVFFVSFNTIYATPK